MEQQTLFKVRDKRNKGWFFIDNEYLNGYGKQLGAYGVAIYVSLCRHADADQKCFPAQATIAEELKIGERTIRNYLKLFEKYHIIQITKERSSQGKWLNNVYWLLDKTEWLKPEATVADGYQRQQKTKPEATDDTARGNGCRLTIPIKKNTNKKNTNFSSFKKKLKPYFRGEQMRFSQNKWWVLPDDGSEWLEFAAPEKEIEWK